MKIPIGVEKNHLQVLHWDLSRSTIHLVLSSYNERAHFSQGLAELLTMKVDGDVIVIDSAGKFSDEAEKEYRCIGRTLDLMISL